MTAPMRFAFADPPYLGMSHLYAHLHPRAADWDSPDEHRMLVECLCDEWPDGWAVSLHLPSLRFYLSIVPEETRIAAWVKPFASFKKGVKRAYTWEPVLFFRGRSIPTAAPTWRDHLSEPIAMKKGLQGAKPWRFCEWVLDGLGWQPGDGLTDLFPGTGVMGAVVAARNNSPLQEGLFA